MCLVLHQLRGDGICLDGAHAGGASRSASKFVDGSPRLAARVQEVDGVDSFLTSLFASSVVAEIVGTKRLCQRQSPLGAIEGLAVFVPAWHIVLQAATWDTLFSRG